MKQISLIYLLLVILTLPGCAKTNTDFKNSDKSLPDLIKKLGINSSHISILIDKSDYKLTILSDTVVIKEYPVVFGGNAVEDKLMEGDGCTPEGTFYMISKYPHKSWSKFIWINYPTKESWAKHNKAKAEGWIPQNAKIGGEIGIHGVPGNNNALIKLKYNWTLGCISLKNDDVNEIYPFISKTTKIVIQK